MRRFSRGLAAASSVAAVLAGTAAGTASAQSTDTTAPVLGTATFGTVGPAQYGTGTAGTTWQYGTGVGNYFVDTTPATAFEGVKVNFAATDDVAVTKLQYSVDGGVNWVDVAITPGPSVSGVGTITTEGNTTVRYRAQDAAGNTSLGTAPAAANTTLNAASTAGTTAIRLASATGRAAGDKLTIDTGANQEVATIASLITPAPAAPNPNVNLVAPLTLAHAAAVAVVAQAPTPAYKTIAVPVDTVSPVVTFPAVTSANNRVGHSATVTPTKTDPAPSSGTPAARQEWIDGKEVTVQPLDASKLSLGKHTYAITANDVAGNSTKATLSFVVTTSYNDLDALVTRYTTPSATTLGAAAAIGATDIRLANPRGRIKGDTLTIGDETVKIGSMILPQVTTGNNVTLATPLTKAHTSGETVSMTSATAPAISAGLGQSLHDQITAAKTGDAVSAMEAFASQAAGISNATIANLLRGDALELARIARGLPATGADATGLGVSSEPGARTNLHLAILNQTETPGDTTSQRMLKSAALTGYNPNARFKVLVMSNRSDGFRHESIQTYERLIQQLGKDNNFDVDLFDYVYPNESIPNPFTSAANLAKYAVIFGVSSVGNNQFVTNRTCSATDPCQGVANGTVVDEQAAFQGYIANGGGFAGIHGASDSMHNWGFYKELIGGEFAQHGNNVGAQNPQCPSCNITQAVVEDASNPSTKGLPKSWLHRDELYNFTGTCAPDYTTASTGFCGPRSKVHPLITLTDASFSSGFEDGVAPGFYDSQNAIDGSAGTNANNEIPGYGADHPISWCQNYGGGRMWANIMYHNWEPAYSAMYQQNILNGIYVAAGAVKANCVTYREVKTLAAAQLSGDALTSANTLLDSAYTRYLEKNYGAAMNTITTLKAAAPATLQPKVQELYDWMATLNGATSVDTPVGGGPGGTVPATLSLTLGTPAAFGAFTPGVAKDYFASSSANVISTAGDATLSVSDPSATATGKLVNGAFSLPTTLQANANGATYAPVGGSSAPTSLLTYGGPVSNDAVTLNFKQSIGANDALRTGSYSKTLTFTLSTTTP